MSDIPTQMKAVVTTGNGGYDKLDYTSVPTPIPEAGEVLLKVLAAGVNNTEINTRLGWYSSSVTGDTESMAELQAENGEQKADGGWNKATPFPLIQGTDCCGRIAQVGEGVSPDLAGKRVLVRACMRPNGYDVPDNIWMASDFDGAFAQFVKVPASEVFVVDTNWTDEELATIPCAYGTAENMLYRANVGQTDTVLITGASGGVGSASVQLAKRRGAKVIAVTSQSKIQSVRELGADLVLDRKDDLEGVLQAETASVIVDNVAGPGFPKLLKIIKRGGRYVSSGAIAGPIVSLDMRDMYLKDVTLIGCTGWDEPVFPNLVGYIERGEIRPLLAKTFPLEKIAQAQEEFLQKSHIGNFVLIPPEV